MVFIGNHISPWMGKLCSPSSNIVPPGLVRPSNTYAPMQVAVLARAQAPKSKGPQQAVLAAANQESRQGSI